MEQINEALVAMDIFGGHDLGAEDPDLAGCALYCFTELHDAQDIETLAGALEEILS